MAEHLTPDAPVHCVRCGQEIHPPVMGPWDLDGFHGRWVNPRGFPWCPGGPDLLAHVPDVDSSG